MKEEPEFEALCRPLQYSVSDGESCDPEYMERLEVRVTEVLGTSPTLAPGEKYIIRGHYDLTGTQVVFIGAIVSGRSRGHHEDLQPGSGEFEVWTEVLEIREGGGRRNIGLLVGSQDDRECGEVRVSIRIRE